MRTRAFLLVSVLVAAVGCNDDPPPGGWKSVPTTLAPAAKIVQKELEPTPADRINYFLAVSKWLEREQERRASESVDKKEILASCRACLRETKERAFDESELPADFRQAFLRVVAAGEEAVDIVELLPDAQNPGEVLTFGIQAGWNYVFGAGDPLKDVKERANRLGNEARKALADLDAVGIRYGARTDWQAMPRVIEVVPGGQAARLGIKPDDFLFSYDGTKLYRRLHFDLVQQAKSQGKAEVEVKFLTPRGVVRGSIPTDELIGVRVDTTCAQPPVMVRLLPFNFSSGFYVFVINSSQDTALDDVVVRYTDAGGHSRQQPVGSLAAKGMRTVDPSEIDYRVEKGETITVEARGFVGRDFSTSKMIK